NAVDEHFDQIREMIEDQDPKIREVVVIALAKSLKPGVTNLLIGLLSSPHSEVRYQAPISLAERGEHKAAKPLLALLERESDVEIRVNVIVALGDLKVERAIDKLLAIAEDDIFEILRFEAACSAGRMGDRRAAPLLAAWADHFEYGLAACTILDDLEDAAVVPVLAKKFKKFFLSAERRLPMAATLARLGDQRGKGFLIAKASSFSLETRILALERLGRTGQAWAIPPLVAALSRKDPHCRDAALSSLEMLGLPEMEEPLREFLQKGSPTEDITREVNALVASLSEKPGD
ncbi:HEAT repeat domain-containing protein, partial [Myxococcota bacterium]|nr:HEAT repeat domain-containing protein [Myxococcota bacterium]